MYSIILGICLLVESVSCMTIWKPDMPGNKYKMKDVIDRADALNNALSLDRLNEIPELTKSSTVTNKDRTYTRTVVQKTYSRDDAKTSTFRTTLEGKENIESQNNFHNAKDRLNARKSEFFPRVSASQQDTEIRKSESVPPLSLSTRRVVTSKTSPAISSKTITTRTSSVQSQPQKTTRRVVKTSSMSDTIPLFSSSSKFATRSDSGPMKHMSTSTVTKTIKSGPSSRSVSSKSSSFHRDVFTDDRSQLRKSTVGDDTSFRMDTGIAAPSGQQREFLSSIQTGIQIPTSTKISTSEFSSSSGSFTKKRRLPTSQASDFTVITVKERLPASSFVDLISNRSTNRKTTSDRSTAFSSQAGSQLPPPTFIASSMTKSVSSSQLSNEATIASPELMPVTAGGAGSSNMMENMIAASIATGNEVKVVERAAEAAGNVVEGAQEVAGNVVEGAQEVAGNFVEGAQEVVGNVIEGAQEVAGNVVEGAQEAAGNLMEAASNVGENMAEAGANVVENMAEGVEKGVEMVKDVAENVAERVEDVIDDGSLPNPLLSTDRGDTDDRVNIRTKDDKDSRSREIGAVRLGGDSGEDSNGDGNSDSEEEGSTTFNRVGARIRSRNNEKRDSNSGEDSNGDGDSDSEELRDGSYARRQRDSNSGEDSNGDGDSDSEERRVGRRRGSRRGRWWRRGGRGSDSSADSGSSNQASDSSDESRDGDRDDSGSDSSSSDSMEDDFDYFEDMNDFWMNGGFTKSSSRRNLPSISTSELTTSSSSRSKIAPNVDLQSSTSGSKATVSPGYQRGDMRRIISQIKNNGGAVISLPEAKTNTMVHFFVKWRKSNLSRTGQKMFIRTPEATVAILRHPNRRRS